MQQMLVQCVTDGGGIIYFTLPESCETMDITSQIYNTCMLLALQFRKTRPLKEMLSSITELDHFLTVIVKNHFA